MPVACPFKGLFKFTYSRGHGECKEPQSSIISCTDEMHLLLNFQACTDVQGSESRGMFEKATRVVPKMFLIINFLLFSFWLT